MVPFAKYWSKNSKKLANVKTDDSCERGKHKLTVMVSYFRAVVFQDPPVHKPPRDSKVRFADNIGRVLWRAKGFQGVGNELYMMLCTLKIRWR